MIKRYTAEDFGKKLVALAVFNFILLVSNLVRHLVYPYLESSSYSYYPSPSIVFAMIGYFASTGLILLFSIILAASFFREGNDYGIDKLRNAGSFLLPATLVPITFNIVIYLGFGSFYGTPSYMLDSINVTLAIVKMACLGLQVAAWLNLSSYFNDQEGTTAQQKGKVGCWLVSIGAFLLIALYILDIAQLDVLLGVFGSSGIIAIISAVSSAMYGAGFIVIATSFQEVETAPITPAYVGGYRTIGTPGYQPGPSPVATRVPIVSPPTAGYPQSQPVTPQPQAPRPQGELNFCPECGQDLPKGTEIIFCPNCGARVK